MLLFVAFVTIGMISYFFTGAEDQSKMELTFSQLHHMRKDIHNLTSVAGALISHNLILEGFGISAFAIPFFFMVIAFRMMKVKILSLLKTFFHGFFWLVWLSVTLGFFDLYLKLEFWAILALESLFWTLMCQRLDISVTRCPKSLTSPWQFLLFTHYFGHRCAENLIFPLHDVQNC